MNLQDRHTRTRTLLNAAGIDIGFSTRRPTAGIGFLVGGQLDLKNCFGVDACKLLEQRGPYDMVAIDGPVLPSGQNSETVRNVERVFCKGPFQRRCKPGMSHVRGTGMRLREQAGKAADVISNETAELRLVASFPRVRQGAIIEAFPNAFLGVCLDDDVYATMPQLRRGKKFEWLYGQWKALGLVRHLHGLTAAEKTVLQNRLDEERHHERQAALVCVLTALLTARGQFTAVGDTEGGWFFLPPWQCWKEWARDAVVVGIRELNRGGASIQLIRNGGDLRIT